MSLLPVTVVIDVIEVGVVAELISNEVDESNIGIWIEGNSSVEFDAVTIPDLDDEDDNDDDDDTEDEDEKEEDVTDDDNKLDSEQKLELLVFFKSSTSFLENADVSREFVKSADALMIEGFRLFWSEYDRFGVLKRE